MCVYSVVYAEDWACLRSFSVKKKKYEIFVVLQWRALRFLLVLLVLCSQVCHSTERLSNCTSKYQFVYSSEYLRITLSHCSLLSPSLSL